MSARATKPNHSTRPNNPPHTTTRARRARRATRRALDAKRTHRAIDSGSSLSRARPRRRSAARESRAKNSCARHRRRARGARRRALGSRSRTDARDGRLDTGVRAGRRRDRGGERAERTVSVGLEDERRAGRILLARRVERETIAGRDVEWGVESRELARGWIGARDDDGGRAIGGRRADDVAVTFDVGSNE